MTKYLLVLILFMPSVHAAEKFGDAEANFKLAMQKLMQQYVDKNLTQDDLYRAATAGMLASLNSGDQTWNKLLTPGEVKDIHDDLSGQVSGVGLTLGFDPATGYAQVLQVISNTPSERAGIKRDDQILSVDGVRYKGKVLEDMAMNIRGKAGASVNLKILRDDKILNINLKRESVAWSPVELSKVDSSTFLLTIRYFTEQTPKFVEEKLVEVNRVKGSKLIVDLRGNGGGGFTQAIATAGLFVTKDTVVASTVDRDKKTENFKSAGGPLNKDVTIVVLTNHATFCAAELLAASLKENRGAKIVGDTTFGKWNAQTVESLPNGFAMKYTVMSFESPHGENYQNVGLKPDLEVTLPKDLHAGVLELKYDISKRLALDTQLKAAYELAKAM
jgi:carboxyl-terminal processing protease